MANDADWVAQVRRWVHAQANPAGPAQPAPTEPAELGYEAAHPSLQSRDWVAAPRTDFTELK